MLLYVWGKNGTIGLKHAVKVTEATSLATWTFGSLIGLSSATSCGLQGNVLTPIWRLFGNRRLGKRLIEGNLAVPRISGLGFKHVTSRFVSLPRISNIILCRLQNKSPWLRPSSAWQGLLKSFQCHFAHPSWYYCWPELASNEKASDSWQLPVEEPQNFFMWVLNHICAELQVLRASRPENCDVVIAAVVERHWLAH